MLQVLRRCRSLALILLLATPGLGGTWLSAAHPCPVDMPWLEVAGHEGHGAQASHSHGDAHDTSSGSCSCIGTCQGGSLASGSIPSGPTAALTWSGWNTSPTTAHTDAPVPGSSHRQPPSTAPPLA